MTSNRRELIARSSSTKGAAVVRLRSVIAAAGNIERWREKNAGVNLSSRDNGGSPISRRYRLSTSSSGERRHERGWKLENFGLLLVPRQRLVMCAKLNVGVTRASLIFFQSLIQLRSQRGRRKHSENDSNDAV